MSCLQKGDMGAFKDVQTPCKAARDQSTWELCCISLPLCCLCLRSLRVYGVCPQQQDCHRQEPVAPCLPLKAHTLPEPDGSLARCRQAAKLSAACWELSGTSLDVLHPKHISTELWRCGVSGNKNVGQRVDAFPVNTRQDALGWMGIAVFALSGCMVLAALLPSSFFPHHFQQGFAVFTAMRAAPVWK